MQEQFSYSLLASGLGILIVFLILVLLSVLMVIIRKVSEDKSAKEKAPEKASFEKQPQPAAQPSALPIPVIVAAATAAMAVSSRSKGWIPAAVSAFLASEEDEAVTPKAGLWRAGRRSGFDPWVSENKLTK